MPRYSEMVRTAVNIFCAGLDLNDEEIEYIKSKVRGILDRKRPYDHQRFLTERDGWFERGTGYDTQDFLYRALGDYLGHYLTIPRKRIIPGSPPVGSTERQTYQSDVDSANHEFATFLAERATLAESLAVRRKDDELAREELKSRQRVIQ